MIGTVEIAGKAYNMKINFYHLTHTPLGKALPRLLEKVIESNMRAVVKLEDDPAVEKLNMELWTYTTKVFLPHGSKADGYSAQQPIYLTAENENPNGAKVLAFIGNATPCKFDGFEKCLYMFDGNDANQLQTARARWKEFKDSGFELIYWQQSEQGAWENRATA
jgi:DNA polymerase III subunit chi